MSDHTPSSTAPDAELPIAGPRVSRRRLLAVGGATSVAAVAVGRFAGAEEAGVSELNGPGSALETAQRVPPTTTTTTVPETTTTVPTVEDGEILFPIVVGEDDSCFVGDNFGACRSGCSRRHEGTDMMADHLLPVRAVVSGTLTKRYVDSGQLSGAGHGWTLLSDDGEVTYKFFHLDHHAEGLEEGDHVEFGQIIGAVGNTGTSGAYSDTNYHLHFEYRPNNIATNSYHLLQRDPNVAFV